MRSQPPRFLPATAIFPVQKRLLVHFSADLFGTFKINAYLCIGDFKSTRVLNASRGLLPL
jgi:hypothetical protein